MMLSGTLLLHLQDIETEYLEKSKDRVIFLDIDGVLNTFKSQQEKVLLLADKVQSVNRLAWETQSSIVISSTWRKQLKATEYIEYAFSAFGFDAAFHKKQLPYQARTDMYNGNILRRPQHIKKFIEDNNISSFVIIDDTAYTWETLETNVVLIDPITGILQDDIERAKEILNESG